jgi:hypothetical protein
MPNQEQYVWAPWTTLLTTAATIGNSTNGLGATFDNSPGVGPAFPDALIEFTGTFSASPTDMTTIKIWFLEQLSDGVSFEYGDGAVGGAGNKIPARAPDVSLVLASAGGTTQPQTVIDRIPPGVFRLLVRNESGVTLNTGATFKIRPFARQAVTV